MPNIIKKDNDFIDLDQNEDGTFGQIQKLVKQNFMETKNHFEQPKPAPNTGIAPVDRLIINSRAKTAEVTNNYLQKVEQVQNTQLRIAENGIKVQRTIQNGIMEAVNFFGNLKLAAMNIKQQINAAQFALEQQEQEQNTARQAWQGGLTYDQAKELEEKRRLNIFAIKSTVQNNISNKIDALKEIENYRRLKTYEIQSSGEPQYVIDALVKDLNLECDAEIVKIRNMKNVRVMGKQTP